MDILYVLGYPVLAIGLLQMSRGKTRRAHDNIDSALLAVGLGAIVWVFLGAPYLNAPGYSGLQLVTALAYPAGDAILFGALARLFFAGGGRSISRLLLFASLALLVVTDGVYLQQSLLNTYVSGGLLDAGWLFSYVAVAAAALHPSISDPHRSKRVQDAKLSLARLSFAICLPILGPALFSAQLIAGVHVNRVVIALSIATLLVLSLARTRGVVVSFNGQLKRLDEQNVRLEKAFAELSEKEAALTFQARVLDQVESFVVVVAPDSRLTYMNAYAERYFDQPSEGAIDRVWNDVFGDIDADDLADLAAGMDERGAWEGNLEISVKGEERVVHIAASHLHDEAGKQVATICIGLDITQGQELEDRLRRVQKLEAFGQLAGGIAHDFNNLLAVVLNYGKFLVEDLEEGDDRRKDAQEIVRAGERGASLARQLLTFSRKNNAKPETLILNDVVREMARMLSRTIPENVRFTMDLSDDLAFARVDPGHMEQIIMNLVVNARDAMPGGGLMKLRTGNTAIEAVDAARLGIEPGMYASFSVSDEGTGIDEDTLSRIFEPFFTTKEVGKGTGLGLATVYGIVQQAAGAIDVSTELGVGTLFTVHLPVQASDAPTSRAMFVEPSMQGNGEKIIVTEDEDAVRDLVCRMLRRNGYEVKSYSSSERAALEIESGVVTADLLLTDVVMPGLSGPDLAKRAGLRTLLMTGYSNMDGETVAALPTLAKPFDEAELAAAVKSTLRNDRIEL
jgi:signal transduction histidine kinase/CheY-like chemotaxis protein